MKRCPNCYEPYDDAVKFCELDGELLLDDVALSPPFKQVVETEPAPESSAQKRELGMMAAIGVMVGILITTLAYTGYALLTANSGVNERTEPISRVDTRESQPVTRAPRAAVLEPSPAPEEEASPSPEAVEEPATAPAAEADNVSARLNNGPISTGQRKDDKQDRASDKTIIQMNDGSTMEVDAAWTDKQGIWYRRGNMVSFVESNRIKAIRTREEPKPAPVNTPTP